MGGSKKWLSEEALQIVKDRREVKSKGKRKRYIQLKADFQRIKKDRKEGLLQRTMYKNRGKQQEGKTRALFRKTRDIKGTFCPNTGTIKDINGRDLADTEEIKRRWKEYTEELC